MTGAFKCIIIIEVTSNKIKYITIKLFGAHLEADIGLRYIYLDTSAKILTNP